MVVVAVSVSNLAERRIFKQRMRQRDDTFAENKRIIERLTCRSSSGFRTCATLDIAALSVARLSRTYERYIEWIGRHVDVGPLLAPSVIGDALLERIRLNRVDLPAGHVIDLIRHPVLLLLDGHQVPNRGARVDRIRLARVHGAPHGGAKHENKVVRGRIIFVAIVREAVIDKLAAES